MNTEAPTRQSTLNSNPPSEIIHVVQFGQNNASDASLNWEIQAKNQNVGRDKKKSEKTLGRAVF